MSETITEFLLARIAEDEAVANEAKDATGAEWVAHGSLLLYVDDSESRLAEPVGTVEDYRMDPAWKHIARHDPARVLAECAAKRAILGLSDQALAVEVRLRDASALGADLMHQDVLRALATVYADHPDYQPEWSMS